MDGSAQEESRQPDSRAGGACVVGPASTRRAGVQAKARGRERGEWPGTLSQRAPPQGCERKQPASRRERCARCERVVVGVKGTAGTQSKTLEDFILK